MEGSSRRPSLPRLDTTPGRDKRPLPIAPLPSNPAMQRTPRPLPQIPPSGSILSPSLSRRSSRRRTSPGGGRAQIQFDAGSSTWVIKAPLTPPTPRRRRSDHTLKSHQVASSNALGAMMAGKSSKGKERERSYALPVTPPLPLSPSPTYSYKSYRSEPSSPVVRSRPSIISTPPSPIAKPARKLPIVPNTLQSPKSSTTPHSSIALASASTTTTTTTTYSFDRNDTRDSGVTNATSPSSATVQVSDEHEHPSQELWMLEENQRYSKNWAVHPFDGGSPSSGDEEGNIPLDQLIPTFSSSIHGSSESSDDDSDDEGIEYAYYPYRKMRYDPLPTTAGSTPPLGVSSDEEAVDVFVDDSYSPIEDVGEMNFASSSSLSIEKPKSEDKRRSLSPIRYARRSSQVYSDGLAIEDLDDELEEMSFARNEHLSPSTDSPLRPSPQDGVVPFGVMGQRNRSGTGSTVTAGISPSEKRNSTLSSGSLRRCASVDTLASAAEINRKSSLTVSTTSPTDLRPNRYIDPVEHVHPQLALLPHPNTFSLATTHVQGGSAVGRVGKSARGDQAGFIPLPMAMYPTPNSAPIAGGGGGGGGPKDQDKDKDKEKKRKQRGMSLPRTPSLSLSPSLSNSHSRSKSKSKKPNSPNLALSASFTSLGLGSSLSPQSGREKQPYEMWIAKGLS